jgi:hypothetical protein
MSAVEEVPCLKAHELLEKLNPLHAGWLPETTEWVFRGHGDSSWELVPTAHRPGGFTGFRTNNSLSANRPEDLARAVPFDPTAERRVLVRFFHAMDAAGLSIPGDSIALRGRIDDNFKGTDPWDTQMECWPLVALARHAGVPTRLLDWTRRPRIAAYFAAKYATEFSSYQGTLDVWALRADFVKRWCHQNAVKGLSLRIATAPRATNPNLHAQSGLFTVLVGDDMRPLNRHLDCFLDEGPSRKAWRPQDTAPLLRRFSVPQIESRKLLRLLSREGITNATTFPGVSGVVESMRELMLWDEPPDEVHE